MKHFEITKIIIGCFFDVYNKLGYGFPESVYERALTIELEKKGLRVDCQFPIRVYYDGQVVGEFRADMMIENVVVVELKAVSQLTEAHKAQLLNYLNATDYEVGLLLNFGPKAEYVCKVFDNERKKYLPS